MTGDTVLNTEHRGLLLNVVSWTLTGATCAAVLIKGLSKWTAKRTFQLDDVYMFSAMVFAVGVTISISLQKASGLGQHLPDVNASDRDGYQKAEYAWQILYVWSLFFAKAALLQMLSTLCCTRRRFWIVWGAALFNLLVTFIFTFVIAFQCSIPNTWKLLSSDQCVGQITIWNAFGSLDIFIDLITVILPFYLLHDLQLQLQAKLPVIVAFVSRVLIIPFIVTRLVFLNQARTSSDQTFDEWKTTLLTDVHVNLNVILTCIPFLKPVIVGIQSELANRDVAVMTFCGSARHYSKEPPQESYNNGHPKTSYETEQDSHFVSSTSDLNQGEMIIRQTHEVNIEYMPKDDSPNELEARYARVF